jgi:hypothetical protein
MKKLFLGPIAPAYPAGAGWKYVQRKKGWYSVRNTSPRGVYEYMVEQMIVAIRAIPKPPA